MESVPLDPKRGPVGNSTPTLRQYAGMGMELGASICGLTLLGYWIDLHYGTGRKGVMIGAGIGLVGGMYNFIRQAMALSRKVQQIEQHEQPTDGGHDDGDKSAGG